MPQKKKKSSHSLGRSIAANQQSSNERSSYLENNLLVSRSHYKSTTIRTATTSLWKSSIRFQRRFCNKRQSQQNNEFHGYKQDHNDDYNETTKNTQKRIYYCKSGNNKNNLSAVNLIIVLLVNLYHKMIITTKSVKSISSNTKKNCSISQQIQKHHLPKFYCLRKSNSSNSTCIYTIFDQVEHLAAKGIRCKLFRHYGFINVFLSIIRVTIFLYLIIILSKSQALALKINSQQQKSNDFNQHQFNSSTTRFHRLALVVSGNSSMVRKTTTVVLESSASSSNTRIFLNDSIKRKIDEISGSGRTTLKGSLSFGNASIVNKRILSAINRDNILKYQQHSQQPTYAIAAANLNIIDEISLTDKMKRNSNSNSPCSSCRLREKAKQDSLESIKMHILIRLRLSRFPNITTLPVVPQHIIEKFYKDNNKERDESKISLESDYHVKAKVDIDMRSKHISDETMQSDDPNSYYYRSLRDEYEGSKPSADNANIEDGYEERLYFEEGDFSQINTIYVFPKVSRLRHNRKTEPLNFKLDKHKATIIKKTIMHLYVRGRDWMHEHNPEILASAIAHNREDVTVSINRALRRSNAPEVTHLHKLAEAQLKISPGLGQWFQINLKLLPMIWMENLNATQNIIIKVAEPWMRPFVVVHPNSESETNALFPHIEIQADTLRHNRRKRSTSLDCHENDQEVRCCRYPLKVNFTSFGWSFVVAPTDFDAYFCNGECKIGYLEQYTHTHLASLTTSATPCCTPTKMSALSLLYFDTDQDLVMSTIPNMTVEKCSCS